MPSIYDVMRAAVPYSRVINTPSGSLLTMTLAMTSLAACSGGSSATSLSIDSRSIFDASNLTTNQLNGTDVISGTTNNDIFNLDTSVNNITIAGGDGNDTINAGSGNDILRGGQGSDVISAGAGNDVIIIIGANNNGGSYTDSDLIQTIGGIGNVDISSIVDLASINSTATIDEGTGDIIDGGSGTNALIVFGVVNLTNVTLTNIAEININSDVTVSDAQLATFVADGVIINGDGGAILRITATTPTVIDVNSLNLSGVVRVDINDNITLNLGDNSDLNSLTSVQDVAIITGAGTLRSDSSAVVNLTGYYVDSTIRYQVGSNPALDLSTLDAARQPTTLDSAISANIFGGINYNVVASATGIISGTNGIDVLNASAGTSGITLDGASGADTLIGTINDDIFIFDSTDTSINGGGGNDIIRGSAADNVIDLSNSTDNAPIITNISIVEGQLGNDIITGTTGRDTLHGNEGNDTLNGNDGSDILYGNEDNDTLNGGAGADSIYGGLGDDVIYLASDSMAEDVTLDGGDNNDTLNISGSDDVNIDLASDTDNIYNIEHVIGGSGNDTLNGVDGEVNILNGGSGNDHLDGASGIDTLMGGDGDDSFDYDSDDVIDGGDGTDTLLIVGSSNDVIDLATSAVISNVENIQSGDGDDTLTGNGLDNVFQGEGDNDTLQGGAGNDTLQGGSGNDKFIFNLTNDSSSGSDILRAIEQGDDIVQDFTRNSDIINVNGVTQDQFNALITANNITATLQESDTDGAYSALIIALSDNAGHTNNITINFDGGNQVIGGFGTSATNELVTLNDAASLLTALGGGASLEFS